MLIGSDVKLNSPSSLVGQALTEVLQHPERARDALRVLLHLVRDWGDLIQVPMEQKLPEMHKGRLVSTVPGHEYVKETLSPYPCGSS